ncbi:hypothetical protein GOV05_01070 [Candidatus Woesearchaeota archaeon]|nr:hypothetical protein [Candidatus Woesearchaeota archaeon]
MNPKRVPDEVKQIDKKIIQATRIRAKLLSNLGSLLEQYKNNPGNEDLKAQILKTLGREEHFLEIIRKGSSEASWYLKKYGKHVRKTEYQAGFKMDENEFNHIKHELLVTLDNLEDVMRFTKRKIGIVEDRIKKGEEIIKKGEHKKSFLGCNSDNNLVWFHILHRN